MPALLVRVVRKTVVSLDLDLLRESIRRTDERIARLIAERSQLVASALAVKRQMGLPARDPAQEALVAERAVETHRAAGGHYDDEDVRELFLHLCAASAPRGS